MTGVSKLTCVVGTRIIVLTALLIGPPALSAPTVVNVEIDWMANSSHSHRPQPAEISAIQQMFACHGITLNVVVDDSIAHVSTMLDGPSMNDFFTATGSGRFATIKAASFDRTGGGWHYCIFGHDYVADGSATGSSGIAEILGDDLLVSLGSFSGQIGTPFDRSATFGHELGHNLGLRHRGGSPLGSGDYPPNYASIMSYQYQLFGVRTMMSCYGLVDQKTAPLLKEIDYSNGRMRSVSESALDEDYALGIHRIDWNCDGTIAGIVAQDLNNAPWCGLLGSQTSLGDFNDWAALADCTLVLSPSRPEINAPELETCITASDVAAILGGPELCPGSQPSLVSEPCIGGQLVWIQPGSVGTESGTGDRPYNTFLEGYNAAPSGSALYLQPGTLTGGGFLRLTRPMIIAGPGGGRVDP
jgi:hypothetical protein